MLAYTHTGGLYVISSITCEIFLRRRPFHGAVLARLLPVVGARVGVALRELARLGQLVRPPLCDGAQLRIIVQRRHAMILAVLVVRSEYVVYKRLRWHLTG